MSRFKTLRLNVPRIQGLANEGPLPSSMMFVDTGDPQPAAPEDPGDNELEKIQQERKGIFYMFVN